MDKITKKSCFYYMGLVDQENTYNFAIDKLIQWKYEVFVIDRQAEFNKEYIWIAKKSGKSFSATDPLKLLAIVALYQEYGEEFYADKLHKDISNKFLIL